MTVLYDTRFGRDRLFGRSTCAGCLDGILGSRSPFEELCNSTLPPGGDGRGLCVLGYPL